MSAKDESDSSANEDDEEVIFKKYSRQPREDISDDEDDEDEEETDDDSEISYDDEEFANRRQRREIFQYDEEEDGFDYDDGSSSEDFHLDYDEEDEIMQVVVDEHGQANLAIVDEYEDLDDDEDVIIPMEEQSLKTEAEIGSEIFEWSPNIPQKEGAEEKSWKTSLKDLTQRYVRATLMMGKTSRPDEREKLEDSRELSVSSPSLQSVHLDRELLNITNTYIRVTRAMGLNRRSRSESLLSRSFQSQKVSSREESLAAELPVSPGEGSGKVESSERSEIKNVGNTLGNLGKKMVSITRRIGRSFSTNSLSISSRKSSHISIKDRTASEQSLERRESSIQSERDESDGERASTNGSIRTARDLNKSKSLSSIYENVEKEDMKTPVLGESLQKITEKVMFVTKCLLNSQEKIESVPRSRISLTEEEEESVDDHSGHSVIQNIPKDTEEERESIEKEPLPAQISTTIHPLIEKILKREESVEISQLLLQAHEEDEKREKLEEEGMTLRNALKTVTSDVLTVTKLLGSNSKIVTGKRRESREGSVEVSNSSLVSEVIGVEEARDSVSVEKDQTGQGIVKEADISSQASVDIKEEIRKFTDDIVKTTKILCDVKKAEVVKMSPEDVYMKGGIDAMSCVTMEASPTRYDEDSVKKRLASVEIASVLLSAHAEDQKEVMKDFLNTNPATYTAENVEQALELYNKTYVKQHEEEDTTPLDSLYTDSEDGPDKTFSLEKPTMKEPDSIPSVESPGKVQRKASTDSKRSVKSSGKKKSHSKITFKKPSVETTESTIHKERQKSPVSSGALKDRKTFKVSYEIVTDEEVEESGDEYERDKAVDLNDNVNIVPQHTPQPFPDPPVPSPVHHPGSGVTFGGDESKRVNNLDLLRDHCSGRLTPCCNGGQHTINPHYSGGEDISSLHCISEKESIACVDRILAQQPDLLNRKDDEGYTPLHLAVIAGNRPVIKYLISRGAQVNAVDNERHSALHWAIVCGELEALDLLLHAKADPGIPDNHGALPIHYAVQMCAPDNHSKEKELVSQLALKKLLASNVKISVKDKEGRDPLLWAASAGSLFAIKSLITYGASVGSEDKDGLTGLHCAASRGHVSCLNALIKKYQADPNVIDCNGCTALFYAVTLGHVDCAELLLSAGAQPNRQDRKGRTAAHCGAAKGMLDTLKLLESQKTDLWIPNVKGDLPLHESIQSGKKEVVNWFLSLRPNYINVPNNDGRCIIHIAALNNDIEMCKMLIDHSAFVNPIMRNARGQLLTPLDAALHRGNKGCAKYLQLHGGVAASKLTDRNALQKALSRAINESQLVPSPDITQKDQKSAPAVSPVKFSEPVQEIRTENDKVLVIEKTSKTTQSEAEMIDACNQSNIETSTVESQTSPKLSTQPESPSNMDKVAEEKKDSLAEEQEEPKMKESDKDTVTDDDTDVVAVYNTDAKKDDNEEVRTDETKDKDGEDTTDKSKANCRKNNADETEDGQEEEVKSQTPDSCEHSPSPVSQVRVEINESDIDIKESEINELDQFVTDTSRVIEKEEDIKESEINEPVQLTKDSSKLTEKEELSAKVLEPEKEERREVEVSHTVVSNENITLNQDVKNIKDDLREIKNDFKELKTKDIVEIKDSIDKIQKRVSSDFGDMRNEFRSLKSDLLTHGRQESKVNTPLLSEGLIEGRSAGRDTGQAVARESSVMSGFREDQSSVVGLPSEDDSEPELDPIKENERSVIDDDEVEASIKKARELREEYYMQEQREQELSRGKAKDTDSSASVTTVVEKERIKEELDQSSTTRIQDRKYSYSSSSTDSETEKSRKSFDDSVQRKFKKDWEVEEMKSISPKKKTPPLKETSKQSAFDTTEMEDVSKSIQLKSIEELKQKVDKVKCSFSKTIEDEARSLESLISERLTDQVDKMSRSVYKRLETRADDMIAVTTKRLEDKTSDVTAISSRQIEQQSDKIAQETVQLVQYDLNTKTKILQEALKEAESSRKALEYQLKMKTLEVEAALDTAEETRKKIEELTAETKEEVEGQIVNRLLHKHNVRLTASEEKEAEERIKKARRARSDFFQKETEKSWKSSYSSDDVTDEDSTDSETTDGSVRSERSVVSKESSMKVRDKSIESRETQYSPAESFISLHDKYHQQPEVRKIYVQSQEIQTNLETEASRDLTESSTWFPGIVTNSPGKPSGQYRNSQNTTNNSSRPTSSKTRNVTKSSKSLSGSSPVVKEPTGLDRSDSEDSELNFDSVRRQEQFPNRKSSAKTKERDSFLRNKERERKELEDRFLLSSPDRSFSRLDRLNEAMGQKNVAFDDETKESDVESSLFTGTHRSQDPKDSGFSDSKSTLSMQDVFRRSSGQHVNPNIPPKPPSCLRDSGGQDTPRSGGRQLLLPRREEILDSDVTPESDGRSSSILRRLPPRRERIGINLQRNHHTVQQITTGAPPNVKRYQIERRIFQELLELKRLQIRASKANESVIVKQLSERYNNTVRGLAGDQYRGNFLFKEFEAFLYSTLQKIQSPEQPSEPASYSLPLSDSGRSTPLYQFQPTQTRYVPRSRKFTELERLTNILKKHNVDCSNMTKGQRVVTGSRDASRCTHSSHRCHHAAHAYTGVPCSSHSRRKLRARKVAGKPSVLPRISGQSSSVRTTTSTARSKDPPVTLQLKQGPNVQALKLPTDKLEPNKKYYVTFTLKPKETPASSQRFEHLQRQSVY